jgi:hypothetical protein
MLKVSEKAAAALYEALDANGADPSDVFRLSATMDGIDLAIGQREDGDQIVSHHSRDVLAVEHDASDALDNATLDAVETDDGPRLVLEPPDSPGPDATAD